MKREEDIRKRKKKETHEREVTERNKRTRVAIEGHGVPPLFAFPLIVPAIALHYLSTLGALSRARVPVRFDLRRRKVIAQEEVKLPGTETAFAIIASRFDLSISCLL